MWDGDSPFLIISSLFVPSLMSVMYIFLLFLFIICITYIFHAAFHDAENLIFAANSHYISLSSSFLFMHTANPTLSTCLELLPASTIILCFHYWHHHLWSLSLSLSLSPPMCRVLGPMTSSTIYGSFRFHVKL